MKNQEFWLALWGWAARWFAHIWLIKFLEEKEVQISEVSWTSMWSIIAACLAVWMSSAEMEKVASEINYFKLIDFDLKKWLIKWENIKQKLFEIFWDKKIEDCHISLKIVSANLDTWEKFIFTEWKIVDAIRASVSIPWVVSPYEFQWKNLVDGWILNNLPVDVLDSKDVIACSVLRDLKREIKFTQKIFWIEFDKWIFNNSYQILQKTIDILMNQNEKASLNCWKNVTLISPKFEWIDYWEFHKMKEIVEIWYKTAKKILKV